MRKLKEAVRVTQIRQSCAPIEGVLALVPEPAIVLTSDLQVATLNRAFRKRFHLTKRQANGLPIAEIPTLGRPLARLRRRLVGVLVKNSRLRDVRVACRVSDTGQRTVLLDVRRLIPPPGQSGWLLVVIRDPADTQTAREPVNRCRPDIVELADDAITSIDGNGRFISWNKGAERLYGYTAREAIGRRIAMLVPRDRADELPRLLQQVRRGRKIVGYETQRIRKDGERRDVAVTISPLLSTDGTVIGTSGVVRDITEYKRAMQLLRDSEQRISSIVENLVDCLITIDEEGTIESINPAVTQVFGYRPAELFGRNVRVLMPPPHRQKHHLYIRRYLRTGQPRVIGTQRELQGRRKDHTDFPMEIGISEFTIEGRRKFIGIIRDISERKRLEAEIQRVSEAERQRLGRDLHDGLSQQLTAIRFLAGALESALARKSLAEARDAAQIATELAEASRQTHDLARGLFPVKLTEDGIVPALQELAAGVSGLYKIKCRVLTPRLIRFGDTEIARQLYRIAQEAINNAAKHGHGRHIWIRLAVQKSRVVLTVRDDGVGISKKKLEQTDMGLRIMKYRAGILNANLTIAREPGGGTRVTCSFVVPTARHLLRRQS